MSNNNNQSDIIQPKLWMHCSSCNNDRLGVAIAETGELMIVCHDCRKVVAIFSEWPDTSNIHENCECDRCNSECETKISEKEKLN